MTGLPMRDFLFSVPSGEPVAIEPFHYAILGQTQFSGKSTLLRILCQWIVSLGYRVLLFDSKETESDFSGFGTEIPVCLRQPTDSFVLIGLLESIFRHRLTKYYATLDRTSEGTKSLDEIIGRLQTLEGETRNSWLRDAARTLWTLLVRLREETSRIQTVPELKLVEGISRMDINSLSLEAQQLVVKNCFEDALRVYKRKLIMVLDEAGKFIPQGYSSPATQAITAVTTQGAKTGLFVWVSSQFLATTDKSPLKACAIKFLGTQDQYSEVQHTQRMVPEVRGKYSQADIMKLKRGHWILVRKNPPDVRIVYSVPTWLPAEIGARVAKGELAPDSPEVVQYRSSPAVVPTAVSQIADAEALRRMLDGEVKARVATQHENAVLRDALAKVQRDYESAAKEAEWARTARPMLNTLLYGTPVQSGPILVPPRVEGMTIQRSVDPLLVAEATLLGKLAGLYSEGYFADWRRVSDVYVRLKNKYALDVDPAVPEQLKKLVARGFLEGTNLGDKWRKQWKFRAVISPKDARERGLLKEEGK